MRAVRTPPTFHPHCTFQQSRGFAGIAARNDSRLLRIGIVRLLAMRLWSLRSTYFQSWRVVPELNRTSGLGKSDPYKTRQRTATGNSCVARKRQNAGRRSTDGHGSRLLTSTFRAQAKWRSGT